MGEDARWGFALRYLPSARERAQVVHSWINQLLIERMSLEPSAQYANDASMRSRVTAYLSDAMLAYEQCKSVSWLLTDMQNLLYPL